MRVLLVVCKVQSLIIPVTIHISLTTSTAQHNCTHFFLNFFVVFKNLMMITMYNVIITNFQKLHGPPIGNYEHGDCNNVQHACKRNCLQDSVDIYTEFTYDNCDYSIKLKTRESIFKYHYLWTFTIDKLHGVLHNNQLFLKCSLSPTTEACFEAQADLEETRKRSGRESIHKSCIFL